MDLKQSLRISFVGAGNVASHLAKGLFDAGCDIHQIFSRSLEKATALGMDVNTMTCDSLAKIDTSVDCIIIAVKDDAIEDVVSKLPIGDALIVHTSGTTGMSVLNKFSNHGVFYPLQTFSKNRLVNLKEVPFCLECVNENSTTLLENLASKLSTNYQYINSEQRKKLHLAAVFVNNFSNHMYSIANEILEENNLNFDLLRPLAQETAAKISNESPSSMQTGPAKRQDQETIKNHLNLLEHSKDYQDIYKLITTNIIQLHGKL